MQLLCFQLFQEKPYIFQKPGTSAGPDSFEGLLIDVLDRMSQILDVKFSLNHVGDGAFGERTESGTWTGMIGELQRNVRYTDSRSKNKTYIAYIPL